MWFIYIFKKKKLLISCKLALPLLLVVRGILINSKLLQLLYFSSSLSFHFILYFSFSYLLNLFFYILRNVSKILKAQPLIWRLTASFCCFPIDNSFNYGGYLDNSECLFFFLLLSLPFWPCYCFMYFFGSSIVLVPLLSWCLILVWSIYRYYGPCGSWKINCC